MTPSKVLVFVSLSLAVLLTTSLAWAQNPHFINSKSSLTIQADGDLVVKWKEAGLGDAETTYEFSAEATVTCTCLTNSGRCPAAANKQTFSVDVAEIGTFDPKNGTVNGTLEIEAPECPSGAPPTCGNGQSFVLSAISYDDISLTDITNNVTAGGLATSAGPLTFFTCP